MVAGIRGGKTIAGANESVRVSINGMPPHFSAPNVGAICAATYPMLRDVVLPEFFRFCPEPVIKSFNRSEMTLKLINGSKILFRSADSPDRLRGLDLNWYWIDEAAVANKEAHDILQGRVAQKQGCGWYTTTPKGYDWVYNEIVTPFQEGDKDYFVVMYRSIDSPYFPKAEYKRLKTKYTPDFFAQELDAKFVLFAGLVYKEFNPLTHVKQINLQDYFKYYIAGVDWGYSNPTALLIIGINSDDQLHVLREWYKTHQTIDEIITAAKALHKQTKITRWYCDPSEPSFITQFNRAGLRAVPAKNEVMPGINAVAGKLKEPSLFINKTCENLIKEFHNYQYPDKKDDRNQKEEPMKVNDHALDALRYAVYNFKPYNPITIR